MKMPRFLTKINQQGDTIVEVMISLVVLSSIMTTTYLVASRSLHVSTGANQRSEALSVAQSQVELLANARNNDPNFVSKFRINQPFCINPDGSINKSVGSDNLCDGYGGTQYNVGVNYSSNTDVFTITSQWGNSNAANGVANLNLYYKVPGTYKKALVITGSATVNDLSATLTGRANGNGNTITTCYFLYDTSLSYTSPTRADCSSIPPGSSSGYVTVSATISGLSGATTYYFELCAGSIAGGVVCGANNVSFSTPSAPEITGQYASKYQTPSGNNADLNGKVNPNGSNVSDCYFQWGTTTNYGNTIKCGSTIGSGGSPVPVSVNIAPLDAGTIYHFRLVATNAVGTGYGADTTFVPSTPPPTATLSASPTSVAYNGSSTLSWDSTYANSCTGSGFSTGSSNTKKGSVSTGPLTSSRSYSVTCTGSGGSATSSPPTTVTVAPTINSFSAQTPPSNSYGFSISNGQTIYTSTGVNRTLQWTTTGASYCNASGGWSGTSLSANSSRGVTAYPGTSYTLTCYNSSGDSTTRTFNFSYTNSYFTLWSGYPPQGQALNYNEYGQVGSAYGMPGDASAITWGNGIGSLCANLDQRGWGVRPPTSTALCGGYYCWTFYPGGENFLGNIPFNNGGNWASFNDSVVGGIAGRDCNNN